MRGQCAVCGFDCLGGYHRNPQQPDAACRSSFSTSANLGVAETQQQANIGCVRCPTTVGAVRYIDRARKLLATEFGVVLGNASYGRAYKKMVTVQKAQ